MNSWCGLPANRRSRTPARCGTTPQDSPTRIWLQPIPIRMGHAPLDDGTIASPSHGLKQGCFRSIRGEASRLRQPELVDGARGGGVAPVHGIGRAHLSFPANQCHRLVRLPPATWPWTGRRPGAALAAPPLHHALLPTRSDFRISDAGSWPRICAMKAATKTALIFGISGQDGAYLAQLPAGKRLHRARDFARPRDGELRQSEAALPS